MLKQAAAVQTRMNQLQKLIAESDQKIADMLSGQTVNIARRTVTKYREILKLGSSSERKRHF